MKRFWLYIYDLSNIVYPWKSIQMMKTYEDSLNCLWELLDFNHDINLQNAAIVVLEKYHNASLKRANLLSNGAFIPNSISKPCEHYEIVCYARLNEWKSNPPKKKSDRLPIIRTDIEIIKLSLKENQDEIQGNKNDFFMVEDQDYSINIGRYLYKRKHELQRREKEIIKEEEELRKKEQELKQLEESLLREMFNESERRFNKYKKCNPSHLYIKENRGNEL